MKSGIDYIGVGVGAVIINQQGKIFLSQRGREAQNEKGTPRILEPLKSEKIGWFSLSQMNKMNLTIPSRYRLKQITA